MQGRGRLSELKQVLKLRGQCTLNQIRGIMWIRQAYVITQHIHSTVTITTTATPCISSIGITKNTQKAMIFLVGKIHKTIGQFLFVGTFATIDPNQGHRRGIRGSKSIGQIRQARMMQRRRKVMIIVGSILAATTSKTL